MKKFRFPLRSVATVREMRERAAREVFSAAVGVHIEAERQLALVRERIAEIEALLLKGRTGLFRAADQLAFLQSLDAENRNQALAVTEVARAATERERCRQLWLEARRDVRLIEKLEYKAREAYGHEADREQQALLDDRTNALVARSR